MQYKWRYECTTQSFENSKVEFQSEVMEKLLAKSLSIRIATNMIVGIESIVLRIVNFKPKKPISKESIGIFKVVKAPK